MRYPLVDGQGNFGSVDGDPPAAMRYTEARLSRIATALLEDIDKETVDFRPNYDESEQEPEVLPTRVPNLLINGSSGIAVGMATNIPPHNLTEIINATIALVQNPDTPLAKILEMVQGPDFPTGGFILGRQGILDAFTKGRGQLKLRAKAAIERMGKDREQIVVTEIPYQVNKARLIEQAAALVNEKKIEGISEMRDRERPRRHAHRLRAEARRAGRSGAEQSLQAHAAADRLRHHHAVHRQRAAARAGPGRRHQAASSSTASMWSAAAPTTCCAKRASASTSCSDSRRRSTTWTK